MFIKDLLNSLDTLDLNFAESTILNEKIIVNISGWIKTYRNQGDLYLCQ